MLLIEAPVGGMVTASVVVSWSVKVVVGPPCSVRPDKIEAVTFTPLGGDGKTAVKVMTVF